MIGRGPRTIAVLLALGLGLTVRLSAAPAAPRVPVGNTSPASLPGLHNVFRLSERLYTGSVPEGDQGFRSLRALGVRTVLSVDGARPALELAHEHGLKYAHLPFGYDGCPRPTADRLVRAVRDLPGPIYLHCHHGKHRAPSAAAFARIALDGLTPEQAVREMRRAGTGAHYLGLYAGVREYRRPSTREIDAQPGGFPEETPAPPLTRAMVEMAARTEALSAARAVGWKAPRKQPALLPAHEALQLREIIAELVRSGEHARGGDFAVLLRSGMTDAAELETALRKGDHLAAGAAMKRIEAGCTSCHARFRDVPPGDRRKS